VQAKSERDKEFQSKMKSLYTEVTRRATECVARIVDAVSKADRLHHAILPDLAQDLLRMLFLPEWPAAEMIVQALIVALADQSKLGGEFQGVAVESLGLLVAGVCGHARLEREQPLLRQPAAVTETPGEAKADDTSCVPGCALKQEEEFISCDGCNRWFHTACVGVNIRDRAPEEVQCVRVVWPGVERR
jgi:hypothetical protein